MAPTQRSQKRPPKIGSNGNSAAAPSPAVGGKGAGLWRFFPAIMVVVGVVVAILWNAPADLDDSAGKASPAKEAGGWHALLLEGWPASLWVDFEQFLKKSL